MALPETIGTVLVTALKLKSSHAGNEANTKALLIEPLVSALGWDLSDIDTVGREVKVFDGTFLDYALKVDSVPRVYLEAKGISENLDDKKFMSQTINYANNDGVLWCVLTNGLRYRVYKTNEPVAMDQKLLFEVDLADDSEPRSQKAKVLGLISRIAVEDGSLDAFGDRVFTDTRVRKALAELAAAPPESFLSAVTDKLGHPVVPPGALHRSLARVLDASVPSAPMGPTPLGQSRRSAHPDRRRATSMTLKPSTLPIRAASFASCGRTSTSTPCRSAATLPAGCVSITSGIFVVSDRFAQSKFRRAVCWFACL